MGCNHLNTWGNMQEMTDMHTFKTARLNEQNSKINHLQKVHL